MGRRVVERKGVGAWHPNLISNTAPNPSQYSKIRPLKVDIIIFEACDALRYIEPPICSILKGHSILMHLKLKGIAANVYM